MPFPDTCRGIPVVAKHLRQRQAAFLDQVGAAHSREDALHTGAELHPAGENTVAGRGTDRRWTVGIGEPHAVSCKLVEDGRGDPGFGVVAGHVSVAEIVGQDEQDIGQPVCLLGARRIGWRRQHGGQGHRYHEVPARHCCFWPDFICKKTLLQNRNPSACSSTLAPPRVWPAMKGAAASDATSRACCSHGASA